MANRLKGLIVILIAVFLAGCVDSGGDDTSATNESATSQGLNETEQEDLANRTVDYIEEVFLKPQGLNGKPENIAPFGEELYIVNFTFGKDMMQTQTQAYVTSGGKLILGQVIDITKPPETQSPHETPEPTETQKPEEPKRVDVSINGDQCLGQKDAPVTIIEFSDYQCPYCERFWTQTLPQIKKEYIDTGKVKFVYRDYPLTGLGHAYAKKAAEAAECAGEQGKFWEMHDKLFENQGELSSLQKQVSNSTIEGRTIVTIKDPRTGVIRYFDITDDIARMKGLSKDLGLDTTAFDSCLDSGQMVSEVQKDMQDGAKAGVTGTPAFFVNGIFINGAQPFTVFKQIVDSELAGDATASTITGTCG